MKTALEKYLEANRLDPDNLETLTGLLQAQFELGDYERCIDTIHEALDLEKDPAQLKALWLREARCHLFLDQLQEVVRLCRTLGGSQAKKLLEAVQSYEKHEVPDGRTTVEDILGMPMFRPSRYAPLHVTRFTLTERDSPQ
jgi:tetratricopeptide (TPR) repeat protein